MKSAFTYPPSRMDVLVPGTTKDPGKLPWAAASFSTCATFFACCCCSVSRRRMRSCSCSTCALSSPSESAAATEGWAARSAIAPHAIVFVARTNPLPGERRESEPLMDLSPLYVGLPTARLRGQGPAGAMPRPVVADGIRQTSRRTPGGDMYTVYYLRAVSIGPRRGRGSPAQERVWKLKPST